MRRLRPSAAALIAARAGLAVGAAVMMPATLSIVRHVFQDERERALAIGIWASVASAGAALGPVVGGVLLEFFWWGSVFLINVPVVVVALLLALPAIPACGGRSQRPWDALGSLQVMFGLVGVVYAIRNSAHAPRTSGWPSSPRSAACSACTCSSAASAAPANR